MIVSNQEQWFWLTGGWEIGMLHFIIFFASPFILTSSLHIKDPFWWPKSRVSKVSDHVLALLSRTTGLKVSNRCLPRLSLWGDFCPNSDILYRNFSHHSRLEGVRSSIPKYFVTQHFLTVRTQCAEKGVCLCECCWWCVGFNLFVKISFILWFF
jgi:hypothetical protein